MTDHYEDDDRMLARTMRETCPNATLSPGFNQPAHLNPTVRSLAMPHGMVPIGKGWRLVDAAGGVWER